MLTIRTASAQDVPVMWQMLHQSASEQGFPQELAVCEADLLEDGFGPEPRFHALIADWNGVASGLALYFFNYSTWGNLTGGSRTGLYLEDLYVSPSHRRCGVARGLLARLAQIADARECRRLQWVVHTGNGKRHQAL